MLNNHFINANDARNTCKRCGGTGEIMGAGMVYYDCEHCDEQPRAKLKVLPDKRSKSYKESIAKIMKDCEVSRDEAMRIFDEEYEKLD